MAGGLAPALSPVNATADACYLDLRVVYEGHVRE